jgi:hypothetical protein
VLTPAFLAEQHKAAADKFNELALRIDWCLRRSRGMREQFWHFTERLITDFTQLNKEAPSLPTRRNSSSLNRSADTITLSIGAITSLAIPPPRRRHTITTTPTASTSAPAIVQTQPQQPSQQSQPQQPHQHTEIDPEDFEAQAAADAAVAEIERDNARRFEKIRKKSMSTRNIEEGLADKRREMIEEPKPLRWLKKQMGLVEEDEA